MENGNTSIESDRLPVSVLFVTFGLFACLGALCVTMGMMIDNFSFGEGPRAVVASALFAAIAFGVFNCVPYVLMAVGYWLCRYRSWAAAVLFLGAVPLCVFGPYGIYQSMYVDLDPQSALIFLFMPIVLCVACAPLGVVVSIVWLMSTPWQQGLRA